MNNRKILNGFYAMLGLTEQSGDIMRTVDKLDKIGAEKVRTCLMEDVGLTDEQAGEILKFIAITGSNGEVLAALEGYRGRSDVFDEGLNELTTVVKYLAAFGVPAGELRRRPDDRARAWTTTPAPSTRRRCWTTRRSAPSAPAAATTTSPSTTPTDSSPAWASPSA